MEATIIVGNTGRGKSTAARLILKKAISEKRKLFIYDPNNQYSEFYKNPFLKAREFLSMVINEKNSFILFEEATIFFSNKGDIEDLKDLLVRKRHTNNKIVFVFHSLRSIPVSVFELCNYVVLYKTTDREDLINKKFEGFDELLLRFQQLKNTPDDNKQNFYKFFVIELNKPVHLFSGK